MKRAAEGPPLAFQTLRNPQSMATGARVVNTRRVSAGNTTSFLPVAAAPAVPAPAPARAPMAAPLPPPARPPMSAPAPAPPPMKTVSCLAFEPMVRPAELVARL
ncbi:MAG: hypothetical protein DMG33_13510 [Acidobacteria bacterium]|nr:MAG: hypothetical protein DMG33_13510 [Acidobacteriota bacterium]